LDGSPRTLPTRADEAGGTAVKFYELRDNLSTTSSGCCKRALHAYLDDVGHEEMDVLRRVEAFIAKLPPAGDEGV